MYLASTKALAEAPADPVRVDRRSIDAAGGAFPADWLRARPKDGSFLYAASSFDPSTFTGTGQLYWISGSAPIAVRDENACERLHPGPYPSIDVAAVQRAGTGGVYDHLAAPPAEAPSPPC